MTHRPVKEFPAAEFIAITMAMFLNRVDPVGNNGIIIPEAGTMPAGLAILVE